MKNNILVSYLPDEGIKKIYHEVLGDLGRIDFFPERKDSEKIKLLGEADVMVALSFSEKEFDASCKPHPSSRGQPSLPDASGKLRDTFEPSNL